PARPVGGLRLTDAGERRGVLALGTGPHHADGPPDSSPGTLPTLPEELARLARETPEETAVDDGTRRLTFAEL
ncbi:hypothetical protein AN219_26980, partial [Streptomyces nanshensis]